jgi:hypothetical protein
VTQTGTHFVKKSLFLAASAAPAAVTADEALGAT